MLPRSFLRQVLLAASLLAVVCEAGLPPVKREARPSTWPKIEEEACVCPPPEAQRLDFGWQGKAGSALAGLGAAAKIWKALPKRWRMNVGDAALRGLAFLLPAGLLMGHNAILDIVLSIGRAILFGIVD